MRQRATPNHRWGHRQRDVGSGRHVCSPHPLEVPGRGPRRGYGLESFWIVLPAVLSILGFHGLGLRAASAASFGYQEPAVVVQQADPEAADENKGTDQETEPTRNPGWIDQGSFLDESDQIELVVTDGCATRLEASQNLDRLIERRIETVIDQWYGTGTFETLGLDPQRLAQQVVVPGRSTVLVYQDEYTAEVAARVGQQYGEFFRGYAQLRFTPDFRRFIIGEVQRVETEWRLAALIQAGLITGSLLLTAFCFFRLDHATRGFYTTRLLSVCLAAFLILLAVILKWVGL